MGINEIGTLIKNKRQELGLTQKEFGEKLNVSDKAVSKWENGSSYPDILKLEDIAKELRIDVAELIGTNPCNKTENENPANLEFEQTLLSICKQSIMNRTQKSRIVIIAAVLIAVILTIFLSTIVQMQFNKTIYIGYETVLTSIDAENLYFQKINSSATNMGITNMTLNANIIKVGRAQSTIVNIFNSPIAVDENNLNNKFMIYYRTKERNIDSQSQLTDRDKASIYRIVLSE